MKNNLLVISNHDPKGWSAEQKAGWDIDYIPFPNVSPYTSHEEVEGIAKKIVKEIQNWLIQNPLGKVNLQGEFTLCSIIFISFAHLGADFFTFPTTERVVEENTTTGVKTSVFKFIRWM